MASSSRSKVLVIGASGFVGSRITRASLDQGHPTHILIRPSAHPDPSKAAQLQSLTQLGAIVHHGSLQDYESLLSAVREADVVISAVGSEQIPDQINIIAAIKEAGSVKRFLPSEFGIDVDRPLPDNEANRLLLGAKVKIRRAVEAAGIPHTYVSANCFAAYFLASLGEPGVLSPPQDKVLIYGDGTAKVVYVLEDDAATYVIKTIDDPRTQDKTLYIRPSANILSQGEVVAIWEKKIGKCLEKFHLSEEELLQRSLNSPFPKNVYLALRQSIFIHGIEMFEIGPNGVEATQLYPDVKYTTADEYLDRFLLYS